MNAKLPTADHLRELSEALRIAWNQNSHFMVTRVKIVASHPDYQPQGTEYFVSLESRWGTTAGFLMNVDALQSLTPSQLEQALFGEIAKQQSLLESALLDTRDWKR